MKKFFREYVPQILLIVFSVVLGLYLNEKIQSRQDKRMAKQLVDQLRLEIKNNRATIIEWLPYHERAKAVIDSLKTEQKFIDSFVQDSRAIYQAAPRGLFNGELSKSAWETASLNPAMSEISYHNLRAYSKVYSQMDITFQPIEKLSELFLSKDFNAQDQVEHTLFSSSRLFRELIGREYRFLIYCNEALGDTLISQEVFIDSLLREPRLRQ